MADNFLHYFSHRNSQFNQVQLCENSSSQGGPQSPLGGGVMQNASWSNMASNNPMMNHGTGVDCDVNPMAYGQPPPGLTTQQHQQQQVEKHLQNIFQGCLKCIQFYNDILLS